MDWNRENSRVLVCPGFHDPAVTQSFVAALQPLTAIALPRWWIVPTAQIPPYAGVGIAQFLGQQMAIANATDPRTAPALFIIGFSAGVVGAIAAAHLWRGQGGTVQGLLALDGWGVPLGGDFPINRLSHDAFTGATSNLLGAGQDSFYADPAVEHLTLWRSPQQVEGWALHHPMGWPWVSQRTRTTAATFMATRLL